MQYNPRPLATYGVFVSAFLLAACADAPTQLPAFAPGEAAYSIGGPTSCAGAGAVVVSNEVGLRAALASAQPGSVVAVSGMISVTGVAEISIPEGVTLTCAEPGAGLRSATNRDALIAVYAANVSVTGLAIDAAATQTPIFVLNAPATDVRNVTIHGNSVVCGWDACLFIVGAPATTVTNNLFEARAAISTGIHLQHVAGLRIDGSRIENNVITTLLPSLSPRFGAIRPRDGTNVVVRGNTIRGPWFNGIAMAEIQEGVFERNTIEGATRHGFVFATNPFLPISVTGSLFRANDVTSLTGAALFVQKACGNVFVGNRLSAPAATPTVAFTATTGANVLLGPPVVVEDNGNVDCDGDGVSDPNSTTGKSRRGGYAGEIIAPVMQMAGGLHMN